MDRIHQVVPSPTQNPDGKLKSSFWARLADVGKLEDGKTSRISKLLKAKRKSYKTGFYRPNWLLLG
jgi:hypothetical protein